jgi:hypothetical protein
MAATAPAPGTVVVVVGGRVVVVLVEVVEVVDVVDDVVDAVVVVVGEASSPVHATRVSTVAEAMISCLDSISLLSVPPTRNGKFRRRKGAAPSAG